MESTNAIKNHLFLNSETDTNGRVTESSLVHALRNIRLITDRNQDTGIPNPPNGNLGNWIGAIGYLTLLDQIGKCYRPISKIKITPANMPSIQKALAYFSSLTEDERIAIYALRNAFHHDFSLLNINKDKLKYCHHFEVNAHSSNPIVILPKIQWDGILDSRSRNNVTYVNLKALGDLVENIYTQLLQMENANELSLELEGGEAELEARYIFYH